MLKCTASSFKTIKCVPQLLNYLKHFQALRNPFYRPKNCQSKCPNVKSTSMQLYCTLLFAGQECFLVNYLIRFCVPTIHVNFSVCSAYMFMQYAHKSPTIMEICMFFNIYKRHNPVHVYCTGWRIFHITDL